MKQYFKCLPMDKIKINWNKNPIPMDLFLSFLTIETKRSQHFLGSSTGWTQLTGDNDLVITGGIVNRKEYLDHILYGKNLDNPSNNFVNPFYLFEIFNDAGKKFFLDYYAEDISNHLKLFQTNIDNLRVKLKNAEIDQVQAVNFWKSWPE